MRRVVTFVVAVVLVTSVVRYVDVAPEIDLSTPDAIQLAAFNGQLDGYMETYSPIVGEAKKKGHEYEIELNSAKLGISHDAGAEPETSLSLEKRLDKATPVLYQHAASGTPINNVFLRFDLVATQKGPPVEVLRISLANVLVTSHELGVSGGATENLSLAFEAIEVRYVPVNGEGRPGEAVVRCWDFAQNNDTCPGGPD